MKNIQSICLSFLCLLFFFCTTSAARGADSFVVYDKVASCFPLAENGRTASVVTDENDYKGVLRAAGDLRNDIFKVTGILPDMGKKKTCVIIGTAGKSALIDHLIKEGKIEELAGKNEKFIVSTLQNPVEGIDEALVIAGSDKRGTVFGIYELSSQIGVSPWYYWADAAIQKRENLYIKKGIYTDRKSVV